MAKIHFSVLLAAIFATFLMAPTASASHFSLTYGVTNQWIDIISVNSSAIKSGYEVAVIVRGNITVGAYAVTGNGWYAIEVFGNDTETDGAHMNDTLEFHVWNGTAELIPRTTPSSTKWTYPVGGDSPLATLTIDLYELSIDIGSPFAGIIYNSSPVELNYTANMNLTAAYYRIDGGANYSFIGWTHQVNPSAWSCSGSWLRPVSNLFDGDWDTFSSSHEGTCYLNYTLRAQSVSEIVWQNKIGLADSGGCWGYHNTSLPSVCISSPLQLRFRSTINHPDTGWEGTLWDCWNGTGWAPVYNCSLAPDDNVIWEETMWENDTSTSYGNLLNLGQGNHTIQVCGSAGGAAVCDSVVVMLDLVGLSVSLSPTLTTVNNMPFDYSINENYLYVNATMNENVSSCLLNYSYGNVSALVPMSKYNGDASTSCTYNLTGIAGRNLTIRVYANDSYDDSTASAAYLLPINQRVISVSPADSAMDVSLGSLVNLSFFDPVNLPANVTFYSVEVPASLNWNWWCVGMCNDTHFYGSPSNMLDFDMQTRVGGSGGVPVWWVQDTLLLFVNYSGLDSGVYDYLYLGSHGECSGYNDYEGVQVWNYSTGSWWRLAPFIVPCGFKFGVFHISEGGGMVSGGEARIRVFLTLGAGDYIYEGALMRQLGRVESVSDVASFAPSLEYATNYSWAVRIGDDSVYAGIWNFITEDVPEALDIGSPHSGIVYNSSTGFELNYTTDLNLSEAYYTIDGGGNHSFNDWFYQENASAWNCSGSWYNASGWGASGAEMFDGDWGTYAGSDDGRCLVNYTLHAANVSAADWMFRVGTSGEEECWGSGSHNVSLPFACISSPLQLRFLSAQLGGDPPRLMGQLWECWNGTAWYELFSCSSHPEAEVVWEEALWERNMSPRSSEWLYLVNGSHTIQVCGISDGITACDSVNILVGSMAVDVVSPYEGIIYNSSTAIELNYTSNVNLTDAVYSVDGGANHSFAGWAYQENASAWNCSGSWFNESSWGASPALMFDGDWDTYAGSDDGRCLVNYTFLAQHVSAVNWTFRVGSSGEEECWGGGNHNASIPSACMSTPLQLRFLSAQLGGDPPRLMGQLWECWNGTAWYELFSCSSHPEAEVVWEEALWENDTTPRSSELLTLGNGTHVIQVCGIAGGVTDCDSVDVIVGFAEEEFQFYNVTILQPTNGTSTADTAPEVMFNFTGGYASAACQLFSGVAGYGLDASVLNETNTNITVNDTLADGIYEFYINCTNGSSTAKSDNMIFLTILAVLPPLSPPSAPMTISSLLSGSGAGLGSFLTSINAPLVGIALAIGVIGGILTVIFGIVAAIASAFGGIGRKL